MSGLWGYLWPCLLAGLLVGGLFGTIAVRKPASRKRSLAIGVVATVALAALWHGPLGAADRFAAEIEGDLKRILIHYEMTQVTAQLQHGPLTRRVILSGPADDFQRSELVRLIDQLPGVSETSWSSQGRGVPLIVQGIAVALLGFLSGLLLAYLVELRRRYNAQWNW